MSTPSDADTRLWTVPEAALRLRISVRTMKGVLASGKLPIIRVTPGRVLVAESDLAAYVAARREVAP